MRKSREGRSHDYRDAIFFENGSVFKMDSVGTVIREPAFSGSSGLKSGFEKLHFRDGLMWTVGLTVEIKLRLQIPHLMSRKARDKKSHAIFVILSR